MRIAFSARGLSVRSGGMHQLIKSLLPALAEQCAGDELFVFYNSERWLGLTPGCKEIIIKSRNRLWWDQVLLPKMLRKFKIDAVICPKNVTPFLAKCRCYINIADLAYFDRQLNAYPFLDTMYMRTLIPLSVRKADGIFAISEHTRKDIIHYTGCEPEKIKVAYLAADKMYQPIDNADQLRYVRQKYDIGDKFIMYVGSLSPRKNIVRLLEAFSLLRDKIEHKLVLTGSKSWKDSTVYQAMEQLDLTGRIKKLGFVDHDDMPALYNLADAYVYPSLYEGFGLPVLEAMQCGCPVVTSSATSLPEVAGDAAVIVDPLDVGAIADSIYQVLTDNQLRERLISRGFEQAKKFSWNQTAKIMLDTIRQQSR